MHFNPLDTFSDSAMKLIKTTKNRLREKKTKKSTFLEIFKFKIRKGKLNGEGYVGN